MSGEPLRIGITCYPTFGGSGIVATEIGLSLARRGHQVHFICGGVPWRLDGFVDNVFFHEVEARDYPLFDHPYALALASKMVEVATYEKLDLFHVHYAIPHATSAHLARQILGPAAPRLVTTLHGTDITVVGHERSFLPITRFSIAASDAVTVPSQYLKDATYELLGLPGEVPIEVIPNFVDTDEYAPGPRAPGAPRRLVHNSNFRPLKRVGDVVEVFARVHREIPCELVLIGDGPDRSTVELKVRELGLTRAVKFLGKQLHFVEVLQGADAFLLPSASESFGLAALEALSCGVPVVASDVGGLAEVITDGETGFLRPLGAVDQMAEAVLRLLRDEPLRLRMSQAARASAIARFPREPMVARYEACYRRVLGR
ncbi:MAG TPA: N-acetyl-alpha-D-glucosaminyl L-malate synthase BshA [Polyangia bacterium]